MRGCKNMKKLNRFISLSLASIMALSMFATAAFAGDEEDKEDSNTMTAEELAAKKAETATISIPVTYENDGSSEDVSFTVHMRGLTTAEVALSAGYKSDSEKPSLTVNAPETTYYAEDSVVFEETDEEIWVLEKADDPNGAKHANLLAVMDGLDELEFSEPGIYRFFSWETIDDNTLGGKPYGVTVDDSTYLIDALVAQTVVNGEPVNYIAKFITRRVTVTQDPATGAIKTMTNIEKVSRPEDEEHQHGDTENKDYPVEDECCFGYFNTNEASHLIITNTVKNNGYGDLNKEFEYYITIPVTGDNIVLSADTTYDYTITHADGSDPTTGTFKVTEDGELGEDNSFVLKSGDSIDIVGLPTGMIFTVTQVTEDGYTTENTWHATGSSSKEEQKNYDEDPDTARTFDSSEKSSWILSGTNQLDFVNEITNADTGISVDVIPYVLVLVAAACCAVLFVSKKRSTVR
jgi:hypothetical protein